MFPLQIQISKHTFKILLSGWCGWLKWYQIKLFRVSLSKNCMWLLFIRWWFKVKEDKWTKKINFDCLLYFLSFFFQWFGIACTSWIHLKYRFLFLGDLVPCFEFLIFFDWVINKIYAFFQKRPMKNNFIVNLNKTIKPQILGEDG